PRLHVGIARRLNQTTRQNTTHRLWLTVQQRDNPPYNWLPARLDGCYQQFLSDRHPRRYLALRKQRQPIRPRQLRWPDDFADYSTPSRQVQSPPVFAKTPTKNGGGLSALRAASAIDQAAVTKPI